MRAASGVFPGRVRQNAVRNRTTMIKRICLITPPSIFLLDERVFMTLGILKIAAVLEQAGIEVEMLDLSGVENYEEVVRDHVRTSGVTCYGLTATTPQMRSEEHTSELQSRSDIVCRLLLEKKKITVVEECAHS